MTRRVCRFQNCNATAFTRYKIRSSHAPARRNGPINLGQPVIGFPGGSPNLAPVDTSIIESLSGIIFIERVLRQCPSESY